MAEAAGAARAVAGGRFLLPAAVTGCLQTIAYGTLYYPFTVLKQPMAESGIDTRLLLTALSASFLIGGLLAPRIGQAIDGWDGRKVMALATLSGGAACAAFALSDRPVFLFAATVFLGLAFAGSLYDAAFATIVRIAPGEGRRAITVVTLIAGFASTVFWPISHWLESHHGWQTTWLIYALVNCFIASPAYAFLLPPPAGAPVRPRGSDETSSAAPRAGRSAFILLAIVFSIAALVTAAMSIHVIDILERAGIDAAAAVTAAALIGPAQVLGRLAELFLSRHTPATATAIFAVACMPVSLAILLMTGSFAGAAWFALLYGLSNGLLTIVRGALPLLIFGSRGYGGLMGRLAAPQFLAEAIAPAASGIVMVALGDTVSISILLALAATGLLAILILVRSRRLKSAD
jgi:MFS family permease